MQFSTADVQAIGQKIHAVLTHGALDEDQRQFLGEIAARLVRQGAEAHLSDKQVAMLEELIGPLGPSGQVIPFRRPEKNAGKLARKPAASEPHSWRSSAARKSGPRLSPGLVTARNIAIALAVLAAIYGYFYFQRSAHGASLDISPQPPQVLQVLSPASRSQISVIDGDTIRFDGHDRNTRLVGFNTPEKNRPKCAKEAFLARMATARLKELVAAGSLSFQKVRCACTPGTEGKRSCNHGRACGILKIDGRNVGDILIAEGLAVRFVCGKDRCPPTPKPWCG